MNELSPPPSGQQPVVRGSEWLPFLVFTGAIVLIWILRATIFVRIDDAIPSYFASRVYANLVKFALYVVPVFVYVWVYRKRSPLAWLRLSTVPRPVGLLWTMLIIPVFLGASVLVDGLLAGRLPHLTQDPLWVLAIGIVSTSFSSFCEEIFCRGFVLRELWERIGFWKANLVTTILFTLIHWPSWVLDRGLTASILIDSAWIFVHSLLLGYLVKLTNSIWPAVLLHVLNNILLIVLIT